MAKPKLEKELRFINLNPTEFLKVEKRAEGEQEQDVMVLEGYPITFNQETMIGDEEWGWREVIDERAFENADMSDIPLKYNHQDVTPILARTRNGSLTFEIDKKGVKMRAVLLDTQSNKDFYKMVQAGLLDKMSFAMTVDGEEVDRGAKPVLRRITKVRKVWDFSVVDIPAYDTTSLIARSKAMAEGVPAPLENRATEEEELENKPTEGQEKQPKQEPAKSEDEGSANKQSENTDDKEEEERKAEELRKAREEFEFRKRKAIAILKAGGIWQ